MFSRDHRVLLAAAVIGISVRLAFGLGYWVGKPLTHDEVEYLTLAGNLSAGRGLTYGPHAVDAGNMPRQQFGRAPGYPVFLAAIGADRGDYVHSPARVKIVQAVLGGVVVFVIGLIALDAAGPGAGSTAAVVAALYPPLVWISSYVFSETLYSVVALLSAFVLQRLPSRAAAAGCLTGLAILIRPAMIFFVPLAAIWLLRRDGFRLALLFSVTGAAIVIPWTARNAFVHQRFIPVASEGGVTFWTGNHPLARGEGDLAANPQLKAADLDFRRAHPGSSPEDLERLYYRDALRWIASEPAQWFMLLSRKMFYTIFPMGPSYTLHSAKYRTASVISYLLVLPLAIMGLIRFWRDDRRPTALLLLAASSLLAGLVFFPQERFRIPVVDPALIVFAALGLSTRWLKN
jgi:4-amino-4-deoxy-L-arabinose transferase-like glycosyltransferase